MTWHWWISESGTAVHVADHNGDELANSPLMNENGWAWQGEYPNEILDAMQTEAVAAVELGDIVRALYILADAAFGDIERGDT